MENFLLLPRAVAAFLFDAGIAGVVGVLLARLWLGANPVSESILTLLRKAFLLCAALLVATLPLELWLETATMVGSSAPSVVAPQVHDVLLSTHAGRVMIPPFILSLLLLVVALIPTMWRRRKRALPGIVLTVLLLAFRAASGHAAADGDFTINELIQFLHLSSISVWAGGVVIAGAIVLPQLLRMEDPEAVTNFGRQLSRTATIAIVFVTLSGLYNAWRGLDASLHPLLHSQWGGLLSLKSLLVATAMALGAANWFALRGNGGLSSRDAARFTRRVQMEAWVMMVILLLSGFLASSPPANGS